MRQPVGLPLKTTPIFDTELKKTLRYTRFNITQHIPRSKIDQ